MTYPRDMQAPGVPPSAQRCCLPALALTVALASMPACAQFSMPGGTGQVLDTSTGLPIGGAAVTLECFHTLPGHGAAKVRDVATVTTQSGTYKFSFLDVMGCDHGFVHAAKAGYQESGAIHVGYAYTSYGQIPRLRYLTADADVVMLRLTAITPSRTGNFFKSNGSTDHASEYRQWYEALFQAKAIAKTERERNFVRERYCETLPRLYSAMNEKERAEAANFRVSYQWRGVSREGRHDYEGQVLGYCTP